VVGRVVPGIISYTSVRTALYILNYYWWRMNVVYWDRISLADKLWWRISLVTKLKQFHCLVTFKIWISLVGKIRDRISMVDKLRTWKLLLTNRRRHVLELNYYAMKVLLYKDQETYARCELWIKQDCIYGHPMTVSNWLYTSTLFRY
jgi:hypothetical protein